MKKFLIAAMFLIFTLFSFNTSAMEYKWEGELNPYGIVNWQVKAPPTICPLKHLHATVTNPDKESEIKEVDVFFSYTMPTKPLIGYGYYKHNVRYLFILMTKNGEIIYGQVWPEKEKEEKEEKEEEEEEDVPEELFEGPRILTSAGG